jgi:hypothetical protein
MMAYVGLLLAAALVGQAPADRPISGEVVDDHGQPVALARVVFYSPPTIYGQGESVERQTTSDSDGKFSVAIPRLKRVYINGVDFLAYKPGFALAARAYMRPPHRLAMEKPKPRTVLVEGPDGRPIAGAKIALRLVHVFQGTNAELPPSLANSLATSTGADGKALITYMAPRDQLVAVRVTADSIGTQDILLIKRPGRDSEESVISIRLKPTSHFAGRIVDQDGQGVVNHPVEVWTRGDAAWLGPNTVELSNGPLRSAADGSFQTPDNLMTGSTYRVAIMASGKEPILSDWITIGEKPRTLALMVQRPLRTVIGRVIDRQGRPVANIEVFQSGDGPGQTSTRTDAAGHFALPGFRQGPVFLFVRGDGFRFHGQLIKATERNLSVELVRLSEQPARMMKMLADPIPRAEALATARRLAEPLWERAGQEGEDNAKFRMLEALAAVDTARMLEKLPSVAFKSDGWKNRLERELVLTLAETDFEDATAFAESITDPATRAWALIRLADRWPAGQRDRRLALLGRALLQARIATDQADRLLRMGDIAERWHELGEVDRARALFAEGLEAADKLTDKTDVKRGWFAARLAQVNLPAALAIAKDFDGERSQARVLGSIALRLVDRDPAECERLWIQTAKMSRGVPLVPTLCWKLAVVNPTRARRGIESFTGTGTNTELQFFLALGSKGRDEALSRQAFEAGIDGLDRLMREGPEQYQHLAGTLLPIVERIDPARVPEIFWRDVASRLPVGNPRTLTAYSPTYLITHLAWFDRDVAAALFEPTRACIDAAALDPSAEWSYDFVAWSLFDPRAAVARLENLPMDPKVENNVTWCRRAVAKSLATSPQQRWRELWKDWDIVLGGLTRDF